MFDLLNPVVVSVLVLVALSLARVHVIIALLLAAVVGGLTAGLSLEETFTTLIGGLGGQGETALSYILLGTLAVLVARSGLTKKLIRRMLPLLRGRRAFVLFAIAGLACLSQNLVPVHIAFIPILIPPLLSVFDRMKIDRRGVATALTFGLKAPYLLVPLGFGLIFQGIVADEMSANGMDLAVGQVPLAMAIPWAACWWAWSWLCCSPTAETGSTLRSPAMWWHPVRWLRTTPIWPGAATTSSCSWAWR